MLSSDEKTKDTMKIIGLVEQARIVLNHSCSLSEIARIKVSTLIGRGPEAPEENKKEENPDNLYDNVMHLLKRTLESLHEIEYELGRL